MEVVFFHLPSLVILSHLRQLLKLCSVFVNRGAVCICNNSFDPLSLVAHLSNLACSKVCEETKLIPELLYAELLLRSQVWPKGFEKWGPTGHSIALYFFPDNER